MSMYLLLLPLSIIHGDSVSRQPWPIVLSAAKSTNNVSSSSEGALFCSGSIVDYEPCNIAKCIDYDAPTPIDGEWGEWSDWGICTCDGLQDRHRQIYRHAQFGGKFPSGPSVQSQRCFPECKQDLPVNCELTAWSDWSECSKPCGVGQQSRSRRILTHTMNCGKTCDNVALSETRSCNDQNCGEIIDCAVSDWSYWSECDKDCDGGQSYRTREIVQKSENGGAPCDNIVLSQVKGCNKQCCAEHVPVDCVWGEWEAWGDCSKKCGGGERQRQRHIATSPRNGGRLCDAKTLVEVEECNVHSCNYAAPVDAVWGDWSWWSSCTVDCGGGYQFRSRSIASPAKNGGLGVTGDFQEFRRCNEDACVTYPVDCSFSEWSYWSDCSCSCNGHKSRSRRISQFAQNGGKECEGSLREVDSCNVNSAECEANKAQDCVLSEWSSWGSCSNSCDGGQSTRQRSIVSPARHKGKPCSDELEQVKPCNLFPCCPECSADRDCAWGDWQDWSACSAECGGGQQTRYREIVTQPKNGGIQCEANDSAEIRGCNTHQCGSVEYCVWSEWSDFGYCSKDCGGGVKSRKKHLLKTNDRPFNTRDIVSTSREDVGKEDDGWFGFSEKNETRNDDLSKGEAKGGVSHHVKRAKDAIHKHATSAWKKVKGWFGFTEETSTSAGDIVDTDKAKKYAGEQAKKGWNSLKGHGGDLWKKAKNAASNSASEHSGGWWKTVKGWFGLSEEQESPVKSSEEAKEDNSSISSRAKEYAKDKAKKGWEHAKRKSREHLKSMWSTMKGWFGLNEGEQGSPLDIGKFAVFSFMCMTTVAFAFVVYRRSLGDTSESASLGTHSYSRVRDDAEFIE